MPKVKRNKYKRNLTNIEYIANQEIALTDLKNSGASNKELNKFINERMIQKSEIKVGDVVKVKSRFIVVSGFKAYMIDNIMVFCIAGNYARLAYDSFIKYSKKIAVPYCQCIRYKDKDECKLIDISKDKHQFKKYAELCRGMRVVANQNLIEQEIKNEKESFGFFDRNFDCSY